MEQIIEPIDREVLIAELTPERKARDTSKADNEIYIFTAAEAPALMQEVGRLREESFREAGGGTGCPVDVDEADVAEDGYLQLIVWDPREQEIVGGYRFIVCMDENPKNLSTEHYFNFSPLFRRKFLPYTIELGRSFVQVKYQARRNPKGIFALENLWDGLGALMVLNPKVKYFFGKVTMYTTFQQDARNALIYFMHRYFPDPDRLMEAKKPILFDLNHPKYKEIFIGKTYEENYKIMVQKVRGFGETVPPLFSAYMALSATMRTFDTFLNTDFGEVEETGILITIPEIFPERRERYTRWLGWRDQLQRRRFVWRQRLLGHRNMLFSPKK
ncbi:MAG: GNAT family N-acetyltransferase [Rikenellaceae bacterium]